MPIRNFSKVIAAITFSSLVFAEYRVYQYVVAPSYKTRTPASFVVTSTLDPVSYVSYHGGEGSLKVNLLKTWTCKGYTGKKDICQDPYAALTNPVKRN